MPFSPVSSQGNKATSSEGEFEIHGYKARPIIPPVSMIWIFPVHPFNVFLPIPATEKAEDNGNTKQQKRHIPHIQQFITGGHFAIIIADKSNLLGQTEFTSWISDGSFVSHMTATNLSHPHLPRRK